jgi:GAF domain-containing protein
MPISTISILDSDREWFKSCYGTKTKEGGRDVSFCGHAVLSREIFIVENTLEDERFKDNPVVIGAPYIRFYAGVAIHNSEGYPVGVLCVKDFVPRKLTVADVATLIDLAAKAEEQLNLKSTRNY